MKAVFMDYTGTTVQESGREIGEVIMRICKNSTLHNPGEALALWWKLLKQYEESSYKETYLSEDEIVDRLLADLKEMAGLQDDEEELHRLIQDFWVNAPLFPDVRPFFEECPVPIYIISNNGVQYVEKSMTEKGLAPTGIICADMVQAYKPHMEIFQEALRISGCNADEVLHIGDSYVSDVQGAFGAGIQPVLVQRKTEENYANVICVKDLRDVLPFIN